MELTQSFIPLLQHFVPVFTAPSYVTFLAIVTGWILSHRHRYVTDVIFTSGNVGNGHWCRFHRFFSHAAWDLDVLALVLAKLIVTIIAPGATILWVVDDTLCRKRGLTLYGAGTRATCTDRRLQQFVPVGGRVYHGNRSKDSDRDGSLARYRSRYCKSFS